MLQRTIHTGLTLVPNSLDFSAARNAVWAVTTDGRVVAIRLFDEHVSQVGSGYIDPVAAVPLSDGLRVAVAEASGSVFIARRNAADRAQAYLLTQVPGAALAIHAHADPGTLLILTDGSQNASPAPQLLSCDLSNGALSVVAGD